MSGYSWAPLAWVVLMVVSWPYVQRVRYPGMAPAAAYLIFVTTFSVMASVLFGMLTTLAASFGRRAVFDHPIGVLLFLALGFLPGLLMGRWLIQRPLRRTPLPGE
jgi:hypothetical protein